MTRLGVAASQRHVLLVDGLLALGLLAATASAGHSWTVPNRHEFDLPGIVLSAAVMLPLAFRRRYPLIVFGVSSSTYVWYLAAGYATSLDFYGPLVAFATIAIVERPRTTTYAAVLFSALMFAGGLVTPGSPVLASLFEALLAPRAGLGARREYQGSVDAQPAAGRADRAAGGGAGADRAACRDRRAGSDRA
jgi:hypothetical protein